MSGATGRFFYPTDWYAAGVDGPFGNDSRIAHARDMLRSVLIGDRGIDPHSANRLVTAIDALIEAHVTALPTQSTPEYLGDR